MLSKKYRLTEDCDFKRVLKSGRGFKTPFFTLVVKRNREDFSRFGFIAGKKVGKAVRRNKAKRRLREAVRKRLEKIRKGIDVVIIGKTKASEVDFEELSKSLDQALRRMEMYKDKLKSQSSNFKSKS